MVISECKSNSDRTYEIRPNRSLTRRGMLLFFVVVSLAALSVAVRFAMLGAWLVLPFAFLEILVLGCGLYCFEKATDYREVISLSRDELRIRRQARRGDEEWAFQPYWARVVRQPDERKWYPSRLLIRSHGRQVEIGSCLTEGEREQLFIDLEHSLRQNQGLAARA